MKKTAVKFISAALASTMAIAFLAGCGNKDKGKVFDNENDPLVFSTLALDGVFNPFFSTSATDSNIAGLTQIGMLSNNEKGEPVYGDDEAVIVKDMEIKTTGEGEAQRTEYKFVLKNNVRFSNGSYLTMKDVLFNLYVYLDPMYTGSSTIYSTDIVGLQEYRTQSEDENEQQHFMDRYETLAQQRIDDLVAVHEEIYEDDSNKSLDIDGFKQKLQDDYIGQYPHIVEDYEKAIELFEEELETDWSNSLDSYADTVFTDSKGEIYRNLLKSDVEMFLYNEGKITWSKKDAKLSCAAGDLEEVRTWTKEQAIKFVKDINVPELLNEVVQYWMTAGELFTHITNAELSAATVGTNLRFKNISGIQFANRTQPVQVNGVTYGVPTYEEHVAADGTKSQVPSSNEVLSITIKKIDPKAIWNFSLAVAPMYYYSDAEHIAAFDYEENFGVEYRNQDFMTDVVNSTSKIGVPVGAGAYAASKASGALNPTTGAIDLVKPGEFYDLGGVYYERNPFFVMGPAKIKKIRFSVTSESQMVDSLYTGAIDFVEPNAKPNTISELNSKKGDGIGNKSVQTSGYGYIGINAGKVPNIKVRQAIMHAINTQETVAYYGTTAQPIYRSMSLSSWVHDLALKNKTPYYPYIGGPVPENLNVVNPDYAAFVRSEGLKAGQTPSAEQQEAFIRWLVADLAGYNLNSNDIYYSGTDVLNYRFTVVGDESDHPAFQALWHAQELLNKCGFKVEVKTDTYGLQKLSTGSLTVWAAAWSSTIDPDMYQVYHKASTATSVLNWGYRQILLNAGGKYDYENAIINDLSEIIEQAREIDDSTKEGKQERADYYARALDLVMELAVELPTYQRDDLFAYNTNKIDVSTFTPDNRLSAFRGLTADLHLVSLNVAK